MAKTNTPFFSFGSRGSVGESLTTQKRGRDTVIRQLPLPTDPHSLAQTYQRWLYQDYAYLWTLQSLSTRRQYASDGVRFHLTGFQYWMKYQLTTRLNILAHWKLDNVIAGITPDSSPYANNGTVIGASPVAGIIGPALYFDGINDEVNIPAIGLGEEYLFCYAYVYLNEYHPEASIINQYIASDPVRNWKLYQKAGGLLAFDSGNGLATGRVRVTITGLTLNTWHFCAGIFRPQPQNVTVILDDNSVSALSKSDALGTVPAADNHIGSYATFWWEGIIDDPHVLTTIPGDTHISKLARRRHP